MHFLLCKQRVRDQQQQQQQQEEEEEARSFRTKQLPSLGPVRDFPITKNPCHISSFQVGACFPHKSKKNIKQPVSPYLLFGSKANMRWVSNLCMNLSQCFFQSTIRQITLETVSPSCKFGLLNLDGGLFKAHVLLVEVLVMVEVVRKCDVGYVHPMLHDLPLV